MFYTFVAIIMFGSMMLYFKVASYYNIIDRPNERSSHTRITIRGGGILFLIACFFIALFYPSFWLSSLAMMIIGVISFIDDRITLSNKLRMMFHLISVSLMFFSLDVFHLFSWYECFVLYVLIIGLINAYNFMDGINGMTGVYSLVVLGGLQYVNYYLTPFVEPDLIWFPLLACLVFLFYNFRSQAKCFAGDVGSISIAFWIAFLLLKLVFQTNTYSYILFLSVYGVDAVLTIMHRLLLRQNIFRAHRLHYYQVLANEKKQPHLVISAMYGLLQAGIIVLVMISGLEFTPLFLITILPLSIFYILTKRKLMEKAV